MSAYSKLHTASRSPAKGSQAARKQPKPSQPIAVSPVKSTEKSTRNNS